MNDVDRNKHTILCHVFILSILTALDYFICNVICVVKEDLYTLSPRIANIYFRVNN